MQDTEKLSLAIVALSRRIERLESMPHQSIDADALAIAQPAGLADALKPSTNYHCGDEKRRALAKLLKANGWTNWRISKAFNLHHRTVADWVK